jgi:hypothetical protein
VAFGELTVRRNHAQLLLPRKDLFTQLVPALVELALVLVRPLLRHVVRRMRGTWREVDEEGLVSRERLLLPDPGRGLVGHVLHEVVALFWRLVRFRRRGTRVQRRVPLVRLAADEAEEVFEAAAARGPGVERTDRTRLPHRHLMALAELRGRIAVQLQCPRERRHGVGQHRAVTRRTRGDFGDAPHADGVVIAPGQQRLPRRRTQGGGMEAVELEAACRQFLRVRRVARTAERAGRAKANVVDQDEQHIGRRLGRAQLLDRREFRVRVSRIEREEAGSLHALDREL